MNRSLPVLDNLQIASPCSAAWADMVGDQRRRFCESCEKNVYDLTVMTPVEIVDLIEKTEGKFCGRLFQRRDGRVLTDDCPVGLARVLQQAKRRTFRMAAAAITLSASMLSLLAYRQLRDDRVFGPESVVTKTIEKIEKITPPDPVPQPVAGGIRVDPMIMGDIAVDPEPVPEPPEPVYELGEMIVDIEE
ncbi:MAG: hypothetical protein RMA76_21360 [Deltaproteobacteria bacterium]|jgi:hypothetical protein